MRNSILILVAISASVALGACNNAKSPDTVAKNVAQEESKAEAKVDNKVAALNNSDAKGAYDVAMAQADGDHKIAMQRCDSLSGDAQKACKDQADAQYDLAKANAKAMLAAQKE